MNPRTLWLLVPVLALTACSSTDDGSPPASQCPAGEVCDSSLELGTPHAKRADGSVGVSVEEAWPNRPLEPDALSAQELAAACSALAACVELPDGEDEEQTRQLYAALCLDASTSYFWEERAVPALAKSERWTFEAREILKATSCEGALAAGTPRRQEINCEEAGCWWTSPSLPIPEVTCSGEVATLTTGGQSFTRDCARALTSCSETSPTGCTDRAPVACEHPAKDRCDGAVRLGCDGTGKVSFHDCSRVPGGTCGEREDGSLGCIYPKEGCDALPTCDGDTLTLCALGESVTVACGDFGLTCSGGRCATP